MNYNYSKKAAVVALILIFAVVMLGACGTPESENGELGTEMEEPNTEGQEDMGTGGELEGQDDLGTQTDEGGF